MSEDTKRVYWTPRVAVQPSIRDAIKRMAKEELVSVSYLIGTAMADYVTAKST